MISEPIPELEALRDATPPPVDRVRRRVTRRRTRRAWAAGALGALVVALAVGLSVPSGTRDRGMGATPQVQLDAVAEGPSGPRPLADGATVAPGERVVFFVRSSLPGDATIVEGASTAVYPASGTWSVAPGDSVPGGAEPLAWRPDAPGVMRYRAEVCASPDRCGHDTLTLRWAP